LLSRLRKSLIATSVAALCAAAVAGFAPEGNAGGETRTLNMVHVHTGEKLTITYKKNGRYIPSAMARINYFLRDWRKNKPTTMDPRTVDLMWELYADLGSKVPIRIISGYRSAETNGMLKRIGRNVAKKSQHTAGKAIDMYFPDVKLARIRNSAIVREVGGVGYYPGGDGGFVHIDSGSVRYWPRPSDSQLADIFRDYKDTIGARVRGGGTLLASREVAEPEEATPTGKKPKSAMQMVASLLSPDAAQEETAPAPTPTNITLPRAKPALATLAEAPPALNVPLPKSRPVSVVASLETPTIAPTAESFSDDNFQTASTTQALDQDDIAMRPSTAADEPSAQSNHAAKAGLLGRTNTPEPLRMASLEPADLRSMFELFQEQDQHDDEGQDPATKGGPISNFLAKSDRLAPGDSISLRVQRATKMDSLSAADQPLSFD
jgi:uncharacterized protein YcbK (DUF882 family)